jgi:hypothetical protein
MEPSRPAGWLLAWVAEYRNWDASDRLSADELASRIRWCRTVPHTHEHRLLSTILLLQAELEALKAL